MKRLYWIITALVLGMQLFAQSSPAPEVPVLRVALMDFVSDDNSYRSTVALENLVSALQAEISTNTDYDWVERSELRKATSEFKLQALGLIDRAEALRTGHWVNADWAIFGDISTNFNEHRTLSLQVVNLQRADILAETNLLLSSSEAGHFQMKIEYVPYIASALRTLLDRAQQIYSNSQKQDVVGFLFLSLSRYGSDDAFNALEDDFRQALFSESTNSQRFHLVRFQRPGAAMNEANLVLSGLAEMDSNSWRKVADQYVWGDARAESEKVFDWKTRNWQDERKLSVKLQVWDGRSEPQAINLTITNGTAQTVAREMVRTIEPLFRRDTTKPIVEDVRNQISASIFARYSGLPVNYWFDSPEGRRQWFDDVQLLETACLFNPGNVAAREQLLRLRWGTALGGTDAGKIAANMEHVKLDRLVLAGELESGSRNRFFFARRRSDAWGKYVEQFGFTNALAKAGSPSIASEYVLSAWEPFQMFQFAQENQAEWGIPRDVGLHEVTQWKNQFGSEFVSRLLNAPDEPALRPSYMSFFCYSLDIPDLAIRTQLIDKFWPRVLEQARKNPLSFDDAYRHGLKEYFDEIGQPQGDQELLAQLDAANQSAEEREKANGPLQPQLVLPRVTELKTHPAGNIFSQPSMRFLPQLTEPVIRMISFPAGVQVKGIKSMIFHDDALWLAVEIAKPVEFNTVNGQIEKEFQSVSVDHVRLWKMDVGTLEPEPVTGPLATNDINNMTFRGNTLWLALNDDGIAALNTKTGQLRRYESSDGVVATNQFALSGTSGGIVAVGGWTDLLFLGNGMENWTSFIPKLPSQTFSYAGNLRQIVGLKNQLLLYNSQLMLCDLRSNTWTRIADQPTLDRIGHIRSMTADQRGCIWLASDSGLHCLDPKTGEIRSQWVPASSTVQVAERPAFLGQPQIYKSDSQLIEEVRQKLKLRQSLLRTEKTATNLPDLFVPNGRLPGGVLKVATDGDFLWVLTEEATHPLLYDPAKQSWVGGYSITNMGMPSTLACGGGKLWLAVQLWDKVLILEIDSSALESTPRERWLPDHVSQQELDARLSGMSDHERAVYYFFAGNDAAAVRLLQAQPEDQLGAESLFLLRLCFAEMGDLNRASHFEQRLTGEFSDSVFAKVLLSDERDKELHAKIKQRLESDPRPESNTGDAFAAWMMHICDANGDGSLDKDELTVFFELEPDQVQPLVWNPNLKPTAAAAEFLQKYDQNRDGWLQRNELVMGLRNRPGLYRTNFPPLKRPGTTNQ